MSNSVPMEVKINAIAANLKALHALLAVAAARSAEGHQLIESGERNGAIGTVLELDRILEDAKALYGAAIALHRLKQSDVEKLGLWRPWLQPLLIAAPVALTDLGPPVRGE